ncbi:MAG: hypothetical protein LBK67_09360 [Coriobacteriales bacterium]|jgi:hypothetical protein|nr:hypothetical protein [Coriobacteriales bacterium]
MESHYYLALFISVLSLAVGLLAGIMLGKRRKRQALIRPLHVVLVMTFISLTVVFYPVYLKYSPDGQYQVIQTLVVSAYKALMAFVINADIGAIILATLNFEPWIRSLYVIFSSLLCIFAPVLIFSLALSMIKRVSTYWNWLLRYRREAYVFSRLNEKSLALSQSILKHAKGKSKKAPLIAFASVSERDETAFSLMEETQTLGALCFKEDISSMPLWVHSVVADVRLVIIGDDRNENHFQSLRLMEKATGKKWRRTKERTWLYLLETASGETASGAEFLPSGQGAEITVRRIDKVRSFVYNYLWKHGKEALFDTAAPSLLPRQPKIKEIRVFLIGLGENGSMMLRSLAWFGQMDGYALTIDAFDSWAVAGSRIQAICPELVDPSHNNQWLDDDAQYNIRFHSEVDVFSQEFVDTVQELDFPTFVFVSLGDDDTNIEAASRIRTQLLRKAKRAKMSDESNEGLPDEGSPDEGPPDGGLPDERPPDAIHVVVHDSRRAQALSGDLVLRGIGDFESVYSYETILDQELEKKAENVHTYWYKNDPSSYKRAKEEYWHKEY